LSICLSFCPSTCPFVHLSICSSYSSPCPLSHYPFYPSVIHMTFKCPASAPTVQAPLTPKLKNTPASWSTTSQPSLYNSQAV
jgi:hypothetical protein